MEPKDFFRVAGRLLQHGDGPCCRSVISRAYYGLFHAAAEGLKPHGITIAHSPGGHAEAVRFLQNCGDVGMVLVASQLDQLRSLRNNADYELADAKTEVRATAEMWLKKAREHTATIETATVGSRGQMIASGVRAYQARIRAAPASRQNPPGP